MLYLLGLLIVTLFGWFAFVMALEVFEAFLIGDFVNALWPGVGFIFLAVMFVLGFQSMLRDPRDRSKSDNKIDDQK